jgi:hypothetical protein
MSKETLIEWKRLREEGKSFAFIAKQYNVSRQAVWEALDKTGELESKTKHSTHHNDWQVLYDYGIPIKDIAEKFNAPYKTVYYFLKTKKKKEA